MLEDAFATESAFYTTSSFLHESYHSQFQSTLHIDAK